MLPIWTLFQIHPRIHIYFGWWSIHNLKRTQNRPGGLPDIWGTSASRCEQRSQPIQRHGRVNKLLESVTEMCTDLRSVCGILKVEFSSALQIDEQTTTQTQSERQVMVMWSHNPVSMSVTHSVTTKAGLSLLNYSVSHSMCQPVILYPSVKTKQKCG